MCIIFGHKEFLQVLRNNNHDLQLKWVDKYYKSKMPKIML